MEGRGVGGRKGRRVGWREGEWGKSKECGDKEVRSVNADH